MTATATTTTSLLSRQIVLDCLLPLEKTEQTALRRVHLEALLNQAFERHQLNEADRRFATYLAYGTVRHWFGLNMMLQQRMTRPGSKIKPLVRLILRIGLFQLAWMDQVPDFAAVATTLDLARQKRLPTQTVGFINAILQNFIRQNKPLPTEPTAYLPDWWVKRLSQQYKSEIVQQIALQYRMIPTLSIRVNTLKTSVDAYHAMLNENRINFTPSTQVTEILRLNDAIGDPRHLPGFAEGLCLVQDESAAMAVPCLNPQPGERILEIGAAPGTKTTQLATLMQNQGEIIAIDVSEARLGRLAENTQRLGVKIVTPRVMDATQKGSWPTESFDRVLVDVPCSGTGTGRKHPEILLALREADFKAYLPTQTTLLQNAFDAVKPGGVVVYSTCSIDQIENQGIIQTFLDNHSNAVLESETLCLPSAERDGFYFARLRKN